MDIRNAVLLSFWKSCPGCCFLSRLSMSLAFLISSLVSPRITDTFSILLYISLIAGSHWVPLPMSSKNRYFAFIFLGYSGGYDTPKFDGSLMEQILSRICRCFRGSTLWEPDRVPLFEPFEAADGDLVITPFSADSWSKFFEISFSYTPILWEDCLSTPALRCRVNMIFFGAGTFCSYLEFLRDENNGVDF